MPPNLYIKESEGEKNENRSVSRCTWGHSERDMHSICDCTQIKWVKSLDTTGFRDFCFDKKNMTFGQINLFYGANGSGKTSVLEAIEYGENIEQDSICLCENRSLRLYYRAAQL